MVQFWPLACCNWRKRDPCGSACTRKQQTDQIGGRAFARKLPLRIYIQALARLPERDGPNPFRQPFSPPHPIELAS